MLVLDTNAVTTLERAIGPADDLRRWIGAQPDADVRTSIITYEEQMRGWLAFIASAKTVNDLTAGYARLQMMQQRNCRMLILPFDAEAATRWQALRKTYRRLGSTDLKIAAVALTRGVTLVTRNVVDFRPVAGLKVATWA